MSALERPAYPRIPESLIRHYDKVRAEGHCRMCLRSMEVRPLTRHHLIPQRWFLRQRHDRRWASWRNLSANIIPLCRPCHDDVEHDLGARRMLRRVLTQEEIAFAVSVLGPEWLNRRYPHSSQD